VTVPYIPIPGDNVSRQAWGPGVELKWGSNITAEVMPAHKKFKIKALRDPSLGRRDPLNLYIVTDKRTGKMWVGIPWWEKPEEEPDSSTKIPGGGNLNLETKRGKILIGYRWYEGNKSWKEALNRESGDLLWMDTTKNSMNAMQFAK